MSSRTRFGAVIRIFPGGHIRILVILKPKTDNPKEPLEPELHTEFLDSPDESYETLSSKWGANFPHHLVVVQDLTV
jgi:hypothetical protein